MYRLLQNYLDELETAGSAKQLCHALARITGGMELPKFAHIAIPSTVGRQLRLITNYADPWRSRPALRDVRPHRAAHHSPAASIRVGIGLRRRRPLHAQVLLRSSGFGICHGYTIPVHHWHGRFAALTFATDQQYVAFLYTTQRHTLALHIIAYRFHRRVCEKLEPLHILTGIHLTYRERQYLALAEQGKTLPDIAVILNISLRTVKDHIDGAKAKFGVRTAREASALFLQSSAHEHPTIWPPRDS